MKLSALLPLTLAALVLAVGVSAVDAFATGSITSTSFSTLTGGSPGSFTAAGECTDNGPTGGIVLSVVIKDAGGNIVAGSSSSGTGNTKSLSVVIPGSLVNSGVKLTATVMLAQDSGESAQTNSSGTPS